MDKLAEWDIAGTQCLGALGIEGNCSHSKGNE